MLALDIQATKPAPEDPFARGLVGDWSQACAPVVPRSAAARPSRETAGRAILSSMKRVRAIEVLQALRPQLEARGIAHAGVFGSVGRDTAGTVSDVDIVVTPDVGRHLDLIDLGGSRASWKRDSPA